jgi:hypothetical protein
MQPRRCLKQEPTESLEGLECLKGRRWVWWMNLTRCRPMFERTSVTPLEDLVKHNGLLARAPMHLDPYFALDSLTAPRAYRDI